MEIGHITQFIEIEKFLEYNLGKRISNRNNKRLISGSFKVSNSNELYERDEFLAYELTGCSALEVYECYIKYFNATIQRDDEMPRIAVNAKWVESDLTSN